MSFLKYPNDIHCHHAFRYSISNCIIRSSAILDHPKPLEEYEMAIGIGGILYPPKSLFKDVCNKDVFYSLAPTNDDFLVLGNGKVE